MISLFSGSANAVIKTELPGSAVPGLVKFSSSGTNWPTSVIITGVGVNMAENMQFVQSLSEYVYVYAFGPRVGSVQVRGMILLGLADQNCKTNPDSVMRGFFNFYNTCRASKLGTAIKFTVASVVIGGYLTAGEANIINESPGIANFTLTLASTTLVGEK